MRASFIRLNHHFEQAEDLFLVMFFLLMLAMAILQIVARNLFGMSWSWVEPVGRHAVLWIALLASMIGSRTNEHLQINLMQHYLPPLWALRLNRFICSLASVMLWLLAWHSLRLVLDEYQYSYPMFLNISSWVPMVIMPIAFAVMALRYFSLVFFPRAGTLN